MRRLVHYLAIAALLSSPRSLLVAQNPGDGAGMASCPMHTQHMGKDTHHAAVEEHGDHVMGFPHDKTTHHFRLADSGGAIEVTAIDADDKVNTEAIRSHLMHVAQIFGDGDFSSPTIVHSSIPPGVTTMKLLKEKIHFKYEPIDAGGRVRIDSTDPVALAAIHDFLRFQITDHQTGDPLVVQQRN